MQNRRAWQMSLVRFLLGLYSCFYAYALRPYLNELYSPQGLLASLSDSIVYNSWFSFFHFREPNQLMMMNSLLILFSFFFAVGLFQRFSALGLWLLSLYFFNLNTYASSPELPYLGWLCLVFVVIPSGLPFSLGRRNKEWEMPRFVFGGAWVVLAFSYFNSGILKALTPGWLAGSELGRIAQIPYLIYSWTISLAESMPLLFIVLNWFVVAIEIGAIFTAVSGSYRRYFWFFSTVMHLGILGMMDLAQVSLGMLIFHLFLFDPNWLPYRRSPLERNEIEIEGLDAEDAEPDPESDPPSGKRRRKRKKIQWGKAGYSGV